jgi:hypothetical protein
MNRTNGRCLCWIALALFYLSFSASITSAHSHHDYNAVSQKGSADRSDYSKTRTIRRNAPPGDNSLPSLPEATIAVEENRRNINTSTRVRSNQHGLISVSVLVETEELTIMPIALSPGKNDNRYYKKDGDGRAQVVHTFDEHNSSIASPRNNIDKIWTVSVEEIQVGRSDATKDDPKPTPKPYSQLVLLEWKKIKEVNEKYVTESSHDTDIKDGFTNQNTVASKRLYQNSIHFSGTANCTFMIPLESDDSSFHSSSSPTKTFIVSLIQSTRLVASMTSNSLYDDIRSNNNSHERNTTTVLTRRLATIPRKTYSHYQSIIDPVAKVILHHSQRQMYHEELQLPGYRLSEDYDFDSRYEKKRTDDDNINDYKSGYASRNNIRDLLNGESNFLWTLVLLSIVHAMRSIPIGYILKLSFCLQYLQSLGCAMLPVHAQEYNGEEFIDNTHHHDDGKAEEEVDNENCHHLEDDHRCNPRFEEAEEKRNEIQPISHLPLAPSYSDKDAKMIPVETCTCFSKDPRQKDCPKNFKNHDSYNTTFCCGDCDDDNNNAEKEEGKTEGSSDNIFDHILDNPKIVHEEAPLQDDILRPRPNIELTAINIDISTFNDNLMEALNPKPENVKTYFGSSHKSAILPTVKKPKNWTNSLKSVVAATVGPSSRNNPLSQISNNLMNNSEEMNCINIKDMQERSVMTTEPKDYLDPPFKDSPVGTNYIVNCTNETEESDYTSPKELTKGDQRFGTLDFKTQLDDAQRSSSEETPKSRCNRMTHQIHKNPTKDLFEVMHEDSDAKVKIVPPPVRLSSEKLLLADKHMKSVDSTSTRAPNNSYTGPLHEEDILVDNLPTKECPAMNSLTAGTGSLRRLSITHTKNSILGVDQEKQCGNVLDQTLETHDLKKRFVKSSMQVEKPPQFSRKSVDSIERGTSSHTTMGEHLDTAPKHLMRKDQNQDSIILPEGRHGNAENSFSKKINKVKGYPIHSCGYSMEGPSRRRKETTATGAMSSKFDSPSSLPPRGQEILTQFSDLEQHEIHQARLGQSDQDLAQECETKFIDGFLGSPTVNPPKSNGSRVGNSKQIQSLSEYKKSELQKKNEIRNGNLRWKRNIGQTSETEESYVSTLPPDSDYVSDDDPSLLFLGCSTSESQAFESQSIADSGKNERKQRGISNDPRFRKRRKLSRYDGLPDKTALTRDATLAVINLETLQKESSKETDLDSVEVVRVIIPDKLKKRGKRPYRKSNYVADWVPSNELQSMSQAFLHEESWDMVTPNLQTSSNIRVPKSISLQSNKSTKDGCQSSHKSRCL